MPSAAFRRIVEDWRRLASLLPAEALIAFGYVCGLVASRALGLGAGGQPLLTIGAPIALGLMLRSGRELNVADAAAIAAGHAAVATLFSDPLGVWGWTLAGDLVGIACGSIAFARLRAGGWLSSSSRLAAAAGLVALVSSLASAPVNLLSMAAAGHVSPAALGLHFVSAAVGSALIFGVILAYGRDAGDIACDDEPRPRAWEYAAASLLLGGAVLALLAGGRVETALGASFLMLWFALRLGLFATTVAALAFAAMLLAFSAEGQWLAFLAGADPVQTELLRYVALMLLAAPSIVVATVVHDQTRLKRMFAYRARHDGLTRLANRSRFVEILDGAAASARLRGKRFTLLLIDLDRFKSVNDTYGHARGDALLVEVARRMRETIRATDVVARIGGDEFAVVAPVPAIADAMALARRLVETVNQPFVIDDIAFKPSITVGGVLGPDSAIDSQHLMLLADEALYAAKAAGRNCWRFSSNERERRPEPTWRPGDQEAFVETVLLD
jgi:diguanylate cyclase (GGDEF)-like protein